MANPRNFFNKCVKLNVKYEYLNEAIECIGKQALARMFEGHSARGQENTLSAATIDNWLVTLKYIIDNPDHIDNDKNVSTNISPTEKWNDFVNLIKTPIPDETVTSWLNMSNSNLSKEAEKHGMLLGIKNSKAIKNLHERMLLMIERRKQLWNDTSETKTHSVDEIEKIDYNCMNIFELKNLAKTRKIVVGPNKKENIIKLLEDYDKNDCDKTDENDEENIQYNNMTSKTLKTLAKDRGFNCYNNLNKNALVELHTKYDIEKELIDKLKQEELEKQQNEKKETDDKILIFNSELTQGKDLRVFGTHESPLFVAKDIAEMLGYKDTADAVKKHIDEDDIVIWANINGGVGSPPGNCDSLHIENKHVKTDSVEHLPEKNGPGDSFTPNIQLQAHTKLINESGLYSLILRSKLPTAKVFKKWITSDVLPSIRKKGTYTLQQPSDFILQRPMRELTMLSEIDIEAETIEMSCDWLSYTNCCCIYVAYIGDGLIKIGYSDCNISKRIEKHTSSESEYKQFRMLKIFPISGRNIENVIHNLLQKYNVKYKKQSEIYRPESNLIEFIQIVGQLLVDNDLKYQLELKNAEINELKLRIIELTKSKTV
jgi:prophage antirepressor-like protein